MTAASHPSGSDRQTTDSGVVEIRVYTLKPGTRARFHESFVRDSLPLLRRHQVDVVAYGPSLHDDHSYFLMRAFQSLADRTRSEDAFYGSDEWIKGPRDAVLAAIDTYSTVVVPRNELKGAAVSQESIPNAVAKASDVATLLALNDDYIRSVQTSDVGRFREILADDFLCSLPDGAQIDRAAFLERMAAPASISNLEVHDVNVRVFGDFALIHARTTFALNGKPGAGRYTDTWARRNGRWVAIAAHVTRQ